MKKGIEMQEKILKTVFGGSRQRAEKRKNLSSFKKWVLLSENTMFVAPLILGCLLDVGIGALVMLVFPALAIFYSWPFFKRLRKARRSPLFLKRSKVFGRCLAFWFLFLLSILMVATNNSSKMRQENLFEYAQTNRNQKHIDVNSWRQDKEKKNTQY
jgi:hypothetical protein